MDYIHIRDLELECIVGVLPEERHNPQPVRINLQLGCDLAAAGESDDLNHTVDYREVRERVIELVVNSSYGLIEKLAQKIAETVLEVRGIESVRVILDKPRALADCRSVAVEILRSKNSEI